tara:strand:+ start:50 stop:361 length:312 start_codon:yes stop_codon:yes gene_type:complete
MKIELWNKVWRNYEKLEPCGSAEFIMNDRTDNILIVLNKGSKKPVPIAQITLTRGELIAALQFQDFSSSIKGVGVISGVDINNLYSEVSNEFRNETLNKEVSV